MELQAVNLKRIKRAEVQASAYVRWRRRLKGWLRSVLCLTYRTRANVAVVQDESSAGLDRGVIGACSESATRCASHESGRCPWRL